MKELSKFIIIYTVLMTAQTLYNLVDSIQVSRIRLTRYHLPDQNNAPWTPEEEKLLFNLIIEYGADLSLIQNFFPSRSRKQLKRKHKDLSSIRARALKRIQHQKVRESRKSYFEEEILESNMIKWISKPNNSRSSSSSKEK